MLQHILLFIGIGFTNPFVPDFGTQFITATVIGTVVPKVIVSPLHCFLLKIPLLGSGIQKIGQKLEGTEKFEIPFTDRKIDLSRLKTGFSRLLAGYFFTYIIGGSVCCSTFSRLEVFDSNEDILWTVAKSENQPATKQTLGNCANVNYDGESDVGGSKGEVREHKHRRK